MQTQAGIKTALPFLIEYPYLVGLRSAQKYRLLRVIFLTNCTLRITISILQSF